jgi:hypothetical protein
MSNKNTVAGLDVRIQGPIDVFFMNSMVIISILMALNCNLTTKLTYYDEALWNSSRVQRGLGVCPRKA